MSDQLLTNKMLAGLLHTSTSYINNQIHLGREGITVPPSIKLGRKRLWLENTVYKWLQEKESQAMPEFMPQPCAQFHRASIRKAS